MKELSEDDIQLFFLQWIRMEQSRDRKEEFIEEITFPLFNLLNIVF